MATSQQDFEILSSERVKPQPPFKEHAVPLSLIDATVANFALTSAFWCFKPPQRYHDDVAGLVEHLRKSLGIVLGTYPHLAGHVQSIKTVDGSVPHEAKDFPAHARRFGRVYVHYGTADDPGVDFVVAKSTRTLDDLYPMARPKATPIWNRDYATDPFVKFLPASSIRNPLQPYTKDDAGLYPAALAIQLTRLSCGGFVVAATVTHSLGDITALVQFVKDWASVSRAHLDGQEVPTLTPVIDPSKLDAVAAGDIDQNQPDQSILEQTKMLPLARFDWWAPSEGKPWPVEPPGVFAGQDLSPVANAMPWKDWDTTAPVSNYTIHFSRAQVDVLWARANAPDGAAGSEDSAAVAPSQRISRHDAILAHIWSCVTRARNFASDDEELVHCYPTLGLRPALGLSSSFIGSPILMLNLKLPACSLNEAAAPTTTKTSLSSVAQYIRTTLSSINSNTTGLAAHLHSIAYQKSPQRIWNGFLGKRHTIVTTWARAGVYEVDFGLHPAPPSVDDGGPFLRYADGIMPRMDGCILVKEGPPQRQCEGGRAPAAWTDDGVDVAVAMNSVDMQRLLADPVLLPAV